MKVKKLAMIVLGGLAVLGLGVFADYNKMLPYRKTVYGQVSGYVTMGNDSVGSQSNLMSIILDLKNGSALECNIRNWKKFDSNHPVVKEIWDDVYEKEKDFEKVSGYNWEGKFYIIDIEINGKKFNFQT